MDTYLDPVTLQKLKEFEKRRKKIIRIRGVCAVVITVLVSMSVIAFIDLLLVLPDVVRIALSSAAYILTFIVFYFTCLKWYIHKVDLYELARMFESDKDDLKEEVLTAVELGLPKGRVYDSMEFRNILQNNVANLVKSYNLKSLLPLSVIRNWTITAVVTSALCAGLMLIPKLGFVKLMARALAPTANIARVSALQISIVEPSDPQVVIPRGDPVTIIARLSEPYNRQVYIESYVDSDQPQVIPMEPAGNNQYSSTLLVARQKLTYRVYAAKASTKFYTITSRNRPYVKKFIKSYKYPEYSRIEKEQVEEITGDIKGLQGTVVDLKIQADQPVREGMLWIDYPEGRKETALDISDPRLLQGRIELQESATYRVHLKAQMTGFENKFAANYEIQVLPDLIPSVKIEKPIEDLILPSDEIVLFKGMAQDDLGLESVKHLIRVNRRSWQEYDLADDYQEQYDIEKSMDLLNLDLKPGDQVFTKFTAVDIKGNRGESRTVQITISSPGYSVELMNNLKRSYNLRQLLLQLRGASRQVRDDFRNMRDQIIAGPDNTNLVRQKMATLQADAEKIEMIAQAAWNAVQDGMQRTASKRKWQDLVLLGRMISRIRHERLWRMHLAMDLSEKQWKINEKDLQEIDNAAGSLESQANEVRDAHEKMLELEALDNIIHEMARLAGNQEKMLKEAENRLEQASELEKEAIYRRLTRQIKSSVREQEMIEKLIGEFSEYAEYNQSRNARNIHKDLSIRRQELEEKLEEPAVLSENLPGMFRELTAMLTGYKNNLIDKRRSSLQRVAGKRKSLIRTLARTSDSLNHLKWKLDSYRSDRNRLIQMQSKANINQDQLDGQNDKTYRSRREVELRWGSSIGQLHDRGRLEELSVEPLYMYVNDNINTASALEVLEDRSKSAGTLDSLAETARVVQIIQKAYRLLEIGSGFQYEASLLADMHDSEKWESSRQQAAYRSLDDWPEMIDLLKIYTSQLKNTSAPKEFRDDMYSFLKSQYVRDTTSESSNRKKNRNHENIDMTDNLQQALADLQDFNERLDPYMQEARKIISQYAPSLVEQLKNAAARSRQVEQETQKYMEKDDDLQPREQARLEINQLMHKQRELNSRVQNVRNALRRDANVQDMSTKEGSERARDADDSIAILQDPPERAENYLRNASISSNKDTQDRALDMANIQQETLAENLELIARHYENLESGNPEETRIALREAEQMLDTAVAMQQDYDKVDELASLQQMSPEELMQYLENQLEENLYMQEELCRITDDTIQQAKTDLENMVNSERNISEKLEDIASDQQQSDKYAGQLQDLANQAKDLAARAKQLADNDMDQAAEQAKQAGVQDVQPLIENAQNKTISSAEKLSENHNSNPESMSGQLNDFARKLNEASQDLHEAAGKTEVASRQTDEQQNQTSPAKDAEKTTSLVRESEQKAIDIAREAKDLSEKFNQLNQQKPDNQLAQMDQRYQQLQDRANELADRAESMFSEQIPQLSSQARKFLDDPVEGFEQARSAVEAASQQMPRQFDSSPSQLAQRVEDFAQSMNQAEDALSSASKNLGRNIPQKQKRNGANDVIQDTRETQQQASSMENQARQLSDDLQHLDRQRNQMLQNTPAQQQAVNQLAPKVSNDMARAAMHAERLNMDNAAQLARTAEAMQQISSNELPAAQKALDTSNRAQAAQQPVDQAYEAMSQQMQSMQQAMGADPVQNMEPSSMQGQMSQPVQQGQWMARTLDELQAAKLSNQQQSIQQQAARAAQQPLMSQANQMARSRNMTMAQQNSASMTRYMSSTMSREQTTYDMPSETGIRLADQVNLRKGKWGQLRQLNSKELMETDSEAIPEEYKDMVHTYFRIIAERARQKD